jgi:hypothetical protein
MDGYLSVPAAPVLACGAMAYMDVVWYHKPSKHAVVVTISHCW